MLLLIEKKLENCEKCVKMNSFFLYFTAKEKRKSLKSCREFHLTSEFSKAVRDFFISRGLGKNTL